MQTPLPAGQWRLRFWLVSVGVLGVLFALVAYWTKDLAPPQSRSLIISTGVVVVGLSAGALLTALVRRYQERCLGADVVHLERSRRQSRNHTFAYLAQVIAHMLTMGGAAVALGIDYGAGQSHPAVHMGQLMAYAMLTLNSLGLGHVGIEFAYRSYRWVKASSNGVLLSSVRRLSWRGDEVPSRLGV